MKISILFLTIFAISSCKVREQSSLESSSYNRRQNEPSIVILQDIKLYPLKDFQSQHENIIRRFSTKIKDSSCLNNSSEFGKDDRIEKLFDEMNSSKFSIRNQAKRVIENFLYTENQSGRIRYSIEAVQEKGLSPEAHAFVRDLFKRCESRIEPQCENIDWTTINARSISKIFDERYGPNNWSIESSSIGRKKSSLQDNTVFSQGKLDTSRIGRYPSFTMGGPRATLVKELPSVGLLIKQRHSYILEDSQNRKTPICRDTTMKPIMNVNFFELHVLEHKTAKEATYQRACNANNGNFFKVKLLDEWSSIGSLTVLEYDDPTMNELIQDPKVEMRYKPLIVDKNAFFCMSEEDFLYMKDKYSERLRWWDKP